MKFPFSWLKEFIKIDKDPEKIGEMLTMLGCEVEAIHPHKGDFLFEVALTLNLSYAASVYGIARELSALTGASLALPKITFKEGKLPHPLEVKIESPLCPRYGALVIDVEIKPSPKWLQERLEASGLRAKNNVVDVTNYVMMELGHPLHAFDYDKIEGHKLIVRSAKEGEKFQALDGREHFLTSETIVIADQSSPLAIGGVIGGTKAEVGPETKRVVIEAGIFDPISIRRTKKRLGVMTEAAHRFERGADSAILETVLRRAATLLQEIASAKEGGVVIKGLVAEPRTLFCRLERINAILGIKMALGEAETLFKKTGLTVKKVQNDTLELLIPTYRQDLVTEIDLIEEVARLYGYDNIFSQKERVLYQGSPIAHHPLYPLLKKSRFALLSSGLQELLTCNLISSEEAALVAPAIFPSRSLVTILNPISNAHSVMRPSLLPSLLQVVKENANHGLFSLMGFEVGRIHFKMKESFKEPYVASIIMTGKREPYHFESKPKDVDFFDLKGAIENFLEAMRVDNVTFSPSRFPNFHPGRQAKIMHGKERELGIMGELHPALMQKGGLSQPVFYAELNLEDLFLLIEKDIKMEPLPAFPSSVRDWTGTLKKEKQVGDLLEEIGKLKSKMLEEVTLLDVYQSDKLGWDVKNVTLRFVYRDREKTVSFEEVEKEHGRIIREIEKL